MPRKPKRLHPLHHVRKVVGLSQVQLAKQLGVSKATIQSIELGRLQISKKLAQRVSWLTGATSESLEKKEGRPQSMLKIPFDEKAYSNWQGVIANQDEKVLERFENLCLRLRLVLEAAVRKKNGLIVETYFDQCLVDAVEEFHLAAVLKGLLEDKKIDGHPIDEKILKPVIDLEPRFSLFSLIARRTPKDDLRDLRAAQKGLSKDGGPYQMIQADINRIRARLKKGLT